MCADNNHVRTWTVTRFRGMISTQPGSTPLASFKIISLEETESHSSYSSGNDIGERFDCRFPPYQEVKVQEELRSCYFPPLSCELNCCSNHVLFLFRSIWRARRPTGVHSESHSHYQQTLCSSLLYWEEVHVEIIDCKTNI